MARITIEVAISTSIESGHQTMAALVGLNVFRQLACSVPAVGRSKHHLTGWPGQHLQKMVRILAYALSGLEAMETEPDDFQAVV